MKKYDLKSALEQLKDEKNEEKIIKNTEDILEQAKSEKMESPEPGLLDRVTAAFRRKQIRKGERPSLTANLQFDSWTQPAALGVRGGGPRDRQLLFSEGNFDLDLQIVKDSESNTYSVRGQLLDSNQPTTDTLLEGIELHLLEPDGNQSRRITDEYGRFHFSYCSPGDYSLQVILDDHDILLQSLIIND